MITTCKHANRQVAEELAESLLSLRGKTGRPIFEREALDNGFVVKGRRNGIGTIVFRYTCLDGQHKFEYDETLILFN